MGLFGFESRKERRGKHAEVDRLTVDNTLLRNDLASAIKQGEQWHKAALMRDDDRTTSLDAWLTAAKAETAALRTNITLAMSKIDEARNLATEREQTNMVTWLDSLARTLQGE